MNPRILLYSTRDHEDILSSLKGSEWGMRIVFRPEEFLDMAQSEEFSLLCINASPEYLSKSLLSQVKCNFHFQKIPIVLIVNPGELFDTINTFNGGVDDTIVRPLSGWELRARFQRFLKKNINVYDTHPLTKLPGIGSVRKVIEEHIRNQTQFAFIRIDIDHFRTYNELHGFAQGDLVLTRFAVMIKKIAQGSQAEFEIFAGHLGSDDFILVDRIDRVDETCQKIIRGFNLLRETVYSPKDLKRNCVISGTRCGELEMRPLMQLSVVVVTNEARRIYHFGQVLSVAQDLRNYLRHRPGNNYARDRREDFLGKLRSIEAMSRTA